MNDRKSRYITLDKMRNDDFFYVSCSQQILYFNQRCIVKYQQALRYSLIPCTIVLYLTRHFSVHFLHNLLHSPFLRRGQLGENICLPRILVQYPCNLFIHLSSIIIDLLIESLILSRVCTCCICIPRYVKYPEFWKKQEFTYQ